MFGLVTASLTELSEEEKKRYEAVYCGICRSIGREQGKLSRLALSYDMVFLALLLMSLYEPEETGQTGRCAAHPMKKRNRLQNECIRYSADMNVALAYYKAEDDWQDEHKFSAKAMGRHFGRYIDRLCRDYPRQCGAMERCISHLSQLEARGCANPDEPANCFGALMSELMVYREDLWAPQLRRLGHYLGRFIYLADAAIDYAGDKRKGKYNPFIAMGCGADFNRWEEYLVQAMAGCTDAYERLPLVQDKGLLDNILYSGVWLNYRRAQNRSRKENQNG